MGLFEDSQGSAGQETGGEALDGGMPSTPSDDRSEIFEVVD